MSATAGRMTAALPLSPSVVIMPSGLQFEVTMPVTDDILTRCENVRFIEFICDPLISVL